MTKKHEHPLTQVLLFYCVILIIGLSIATIIDKEEIRELQKEISSMPHYECWNETVGIEKPKLQDGWYYAENNTCDEGFLIKTNPISRTPVEDGFLIAEIITHSETCLVPKTIEVCQLNKHDVLTRKSAQ